MGCFLGCFGGAKDQDRRKRRIKSRSPQIQRNRVQNVHQESGTTEQKTITESPPINSVSELLIKPTGEEQLSPSPRKKVTFNANVSIQESIDSLPGCNEDVGRVKGEDLENSTSSHSLYEDDRSIISTIVSFPPNHRYYNARHSDDEAEEYDSDSDDFDDLDDEDDYDDDYNEHVNGMDENSMEKAVNEGAEKLTVKILPHDHGSKSNGRDRRDLVNSVLNHPIENVTQWKAAKSKGTYPMKPKENCSFNSEADKLKNENQEMAVDASLSKWLQP